jgi:predicted NUDIX family phosphoesterase
MTLTHERNTLMDSTTQEILTSTPLQQILANTKKPQFILAIDAAYFTGLNADNFPIDGVNIYPATRFLLEAQSHLAIRERDALENNPTYRQLLPYMIVKYVDCPDGLTRYAVYKRLPGAGEQRLVNMFSLGYGGHIDADSLVWAQGNVLDLDSTIRASTAREKREEVTAEDPQHVNELNMHAAVYANRFIVSTHTPVDCVHLGIVMELVLPYHLAVKPNEELLQGMGIMTAQEALNLDGTMESWSRLYLEHELGHNV